MKKNGRNTFKTRKKVAKMVDTSWKESRKGYTKNDLIHMAKWLAEILLDGETKLITKLLKKKFNYK